MKSAPSLKPFSVPTGIAIALAAWACTGASAAHRLRPVHADVAGFAVESLGGGRVRLEWRGGQRELALAEDISGCTGELWDHSTEERFDASPELEVLDEVEAGGFGYLVLMATAQSNCSIQGMCGAATDATLIWLKLSKALDLVDKQTFVLEDCREGRGAKVDLADGDFLKAKDLPWRGSRLEVAFIEYLTPTEAEGQLTYDRSHPDLGLRLQGLDGGTAGSF